MAVSQTLTVTEVVGSVNNTDNTSKVRILWKSTQTGESWNGYTRTAKYYISVNGAAEAEFSVNYTLPQSATVTILDTTITVTHKGDGSGTVRVRTWMDTSISAGVVEKTQSVTLTTIPRASAITSALNKYLDTTCSVAWTPKATAFRYKLKFALGSWSYTTGAIHPNTTSSYTYSGYTLPLAVANQLPSAKSGTMTVTLYTYSDSGATTQVGSASSKTFTVTVPDNTSTKPSITMALTAVNSLGSKFSGLYIQGKSKVVATLSGSGKYSATISSYKMSTLGKDYTSSPYQSDYLTTTGSVAVKGRATDSRGYYNEVSQNITVIPYSNPQILPASGESAIICARCDGSGKITGSGTYLKIKAKRSYSKVESGGTQKNFCTIRYRYKVENSDTFSSWATILAGSSTSDTIDSDPIANIVSSTTTAYVVQVGVIDDIGQSNYVQFNIPTDFVTVDIPEARRGKRIGIGRYAEETDEPGIDIGMDLYFDEGTEIHGLYEDSVSEVGYYTHEVTDSVTVGTWRYRKWKSGNFDLTGAFTLKLGASNTLGSGFYSNQIRIKLPFDTVSIQYTGSATGQYYWIVNANLVSGESAIVFNLARFTAIDTTNVVPVRLIGHGRWK